MHALAASTFCLLPAILCGLLGAQQPAPDDLVWRTPCSGPEQSMPIGNGEVGCNVWCTADGVLHAYVARTDSFSEASRLLKLGAFEVPLRAPAAGEFFEQRLVLQDGAIRVTIGEGEAKVVATLFVDSEADVVHVTIDSGARRHSELRLRSWRREDRRLRGDELAASWTMKDAPEDVAVTESADVHSAPRDLVGRSDGIAIHHCNRSSVVAFTAARQGLPTTAVPDPLLGRTFGLVAVGDGAHHGNAISFETMPLLTGSAHQHAFRIAAPCLVVGTDDDEHAALRAAAATALAGSLSAKAGERTRAWWRSFWQRSFVVVDGDAPPAISANAHPLRVGVDSGGGNRFVGSIDAVTLFDAASGGDELFAAKPGKTLPQEVATLRTLAATRGLRITATITQDAQHPIGRIVDKLTAGRNDGFLFDTHPGRSLRLIVGDRELLAKDVLRAGATHEVAATFDAASGRMTITCDGKLVADSEAGANVRVADPAPRSRLTQALALQRWVQACGGRGKFPIKFNGSIFTVEPKPTGGQTHDADWRRWGDCFWWQNTRLPYYPMLAQGDFDMQAPLFRLYRATLPAAIARAKAWHGKDGVYWPETMTPFGTHGNSDYGWKRDGVPASKVLCPWWEYCRNQGLELVALMLDRYDFERDPKFFTDELLPIAGPVLQWFANAYPRRDDGTVRLTPTQSLETHWHGVEDDLPTVAGLHWCLHRLRTLAPELVPKEQLAAWDALAKALPPIPRRTVDNVSLLAPAAKYDPSRQNCESPELYAVFPFRHFGLGKPELELARATFAARHDRFTNGWPQDGQDAALLGLVDEARTNVLAKLQNHNRAHRFPAMWGPNFDWCPDQCHGSNLLDTVHRMLLQADDDRILLLPCWPKQWNVSFRLHAPRRTIVECEFRDGIVQRLVVTPKERERDVVRPKQGN